MPALLDILKDPNYINANEATKRAIFDRWAPSDPNYTTANEATQAAIQQRFGLIDFAPVEQPPEEPQSVFRQVADVPLGVAKGAVQGVRMIADAFGAGSDTSKVIKGAEDYLGGLMSAAAKKDQAEIQRLMKDAEDKGVLEQVKAGFQAFATAPVDMLSQAFGTAVPVILATVGSSLLGGGAGVATGVSALTGAGMGAGVVKGSIYEATKQALIEAGAQPEEAEKRAQLAQEYGGKNLDQILLGTVLGGVAAVGPLEKGAAGALARRILGKVSGEEAAETTAEQAAKGALRRRAEAAGLEAVPEAVQAGQEQAAQNIALQREGFEVPTMRGVAGASTLEGLAGAGLGALAGGRRPTPRVEPVVEPPAPEAPPAPSRALEFKPEPYIQFPDGTVAKQSEVEAYIKTLPEDQQMAMRTKLLGLAPQEADKEPAPPTKALEFKPEPLIVYPDGSVAKRSEVDAYIQGLPEDEQIPARAKLLGMGEEATQVTPEMLRKLGIRGRAPIIQRLSGLELTDPRVQEELTSFAQQSFASPEVRGNIFGFLSAIKATSATPVAPPPVSEAPTPVAPLVEPPATPVAPPTELQAPLVTPSAPPVELVAPVAEAAAPPAQSVAPTKAEPAPQSPVEPSAGKVLPLTPALQGLGKGQLELYNFADAIEQAKKPITGYDYETVVDRKEIDDRVSTPESLMRDLTGNKNSLKNIDGKIRSGNRTSATYRTLIDAWVTTSQVQNRIDQSKRENPELWKAYEERQRKLQDLEVGDEVENFDGERAVIDAKFGQNWRIAFPKGGRGRLEGEKTLVPPSALRPVEEAKPKVEAPAAEAPPAPEKLAESEGPTKTQGASEFGTLERYLQIKSRPASQEQDGDIAIVAGGGEIKFVTFDEAVEAARLAVATGVEPVPFQIHNATGIRLGDTDRVIKALEAAEGPKDIQPRKYEFLTTSEPAIDSDRIPSYKRGVETLRKKLDRGEITTDEFANRVDFLAKQVEKARLAKDIPTRERGADYIRQRLLEAKRRGDLSAETVDFAEWFIQNNPKLVDDLAISIRAPKGDSTAGVYNKLARIAVLMKDSSKDTTAVHEILHHLERMMPKEIQSAIRKSWAKSLAEAQKKATTDSDKQFFQHVLDYHQSGKQSDLNKAEKLIQDGEVDYTNYQYTSPSEFWAVNGTDIMQGRFDVKGSLLGRLKQWLSELTEKAKDLFGLDNKAAIIRALDSLSKGDGKFVTNEMLDEFAVEPKDIRAKAAKAKEDIIVAGREAGQKRKLDKGAFEGVNEDLFEKLKPVFAPRNVTIQDRIIGMRDNFWQRVAQGMADQFRTIKDYSYDAYMKARLSKSIDGGVEGLMFYGQVFNDDGALNIKKNTRGMFDILKPVGKELDRYLIYIALSRDAALPEGKRSIDPDLVARRGELIDGTLNGKPRKEIYEQVRKDMNLLNRSVLKVAVDSGLLNTTEGAIKDIEANENLTDEQKREKIAELRKNPIGYERFINDLNYIPFYKIMEDGDTDAVAKAVSASGLTSQYFSKALKGGEKPFGDLMENTLKNWSHILSASMKNQAAVAAMDAAVKAGVAVPNLKPQYDFVDGKVVFRKNGEVVGDGSIRADMTESEKGAVKIVVDGKNTYYNVSDPLLMDSITSIGFLGTQSKFLDVARDFKNLLQYGVTISPQFRVNNLIRDAVGAMGVSELRLNPVANVLQGVSLSDRNSPTYIAAMAGGGIFNFGTAYEGDQSKMIKRLLKMGVDRDHILDSDSKIATGLKYAWDKYQEWGNKAENANRLALYQQLRDKGMSHLEASFKARDLMDFSMQGSWPAFRVLTQVIPFLNARVQGLYKLGRDGISPTARVINNTLTGKPIEASDKQKAQQFSIVLMGVTLASALLYLTFKDDEEYKRRDDWDKDNFWWFRVPGMEFALRVPKPFEIGAFGTVVERTLEQILDSGAEGKEFGDALFRMLTNTFAINPIPQVFKPLVDIYANKDSFTGAPIESAGLERLSKQERMVDTTSPLAIALGKVSSLFPETFEISPVQADYLIKGYLGWLGGTIAATSTYATMPFKEGEYPDARWMDRLSLGLARELPGRGAKFVTAFYESNKEIAQAYADMRHYAAIGDSEKVQELLEKKGDKIRLAKFYDNVATQMANIRKQIRLIQNDKPMDGAAKKEAIDRMQDMIAMLAKQAEDIRKQQKLAK